MEKDKFIAAAAEYFKMAGYRKNRNYWFLSRAEIVCCVFMQNSQWSAEDYYVEAGIALKKDAGEKPSLTNWYVRKRCVDENDNDKNISLDDVVRAIGFFDEIRNEDELMRYMERTPHYRMGVQFGLYSVQPKGTESIE